MSKSKPNLRRYHQQVWFPDNYTDMVLEFFLALDEIGVTYHCAHQMCDDGRGILEMPEKGDLFHKQSQLIEIYERLDPQGNPTGIIQKALIRVKHLSDTKDFSYVLAREGFIVSAWANDKDDNHRLTYKINDYYKPAISKAA